MGEKEYNLQMVKRYGNFWRRVVSLNNLRRAHWMASKDKSHYYAVQKTEENLEERLLEIREMLINHTYEVSPYSVSVLRDSTKDRILFKLPYFPDRIIQWAIMLQIEPVFQKIFTNFTCASISGRGTAYASKMLEGFMYDDPEGTGYCLKMDVRKFYPSINREILKKLLRRKFKDKDLLIEIDKIIDSTATIDLSDLDYDEKEKAYYMRPGKGIPIGSYLSQYLANYYLSFYDHWLKEELKCKYVVRYMDDIVVLSDNKEYLHEILDKTIDYFTNELDLEIKPNYQIFPTAVRGVDFVGYRHFYGYKLLRKSSAKKFKKLADKIGIDFYENRKLPTYKEWATMVSYMGLLKRCDGKKLYNKHLTGPAGAALGLFYFNEIVGRKLRINKNLTKYFNSPKKNRRYHSFPSHKPIYKGGLAIENI